jgi:hypothetical protein
MIHSNYHLQPYISHYQALQQRIQYQPEPLPAPRLEERNGHQIIVYRKHKKRKPNNYFKLRAEPISCYPPVRVGKVQQTAHDTPRYWPEDLTLLGLTEDERYEIDIHLKEALQSGNYSFGKKEITYYYKGQNRTHKLPITIMEYDDKIILLSKVIFKEQDSRKIKWAYDLTNGAFLIKKRVEGGFERDIVEHMTQKRERRGIVEEFIPRDVLLDHHIKKQIIEPVRDGDISILFRSIPFFDFSSRCAIVCDLLHDLNDLHTLTGCEITLWL